jgi:hypothetical protein|tara:strand:+ start:255 stop:932 length:678 start_codon:yes stop_codon:yes gene_type:complete
MLALTTAPVALATTTTTTTTLRRRATTIAKKRASSQRARASSVAVRRGSALVVRAASEGEDAAPDSRAYREAKEPELGGIIGKVVSNLPDGRKASAPESYGARPASKTLSEGRYRRPPPERVGGVTESAVRGDDFEVVDGPSFGIGTLVGVLVAAATLGGAYFTVQKLQEGPVARKGGARMPAFDSEIGNASKPDAAPAAAVVEAPAVVEEVAVVEAPAVEVDAN